MSQTRKSFSSLLQQQNEDFIKRCHRHYLTGPGRVFNEFKHTDLIDEDESKNWSDTLSSIIKTLDIDREWSTKAYEEDKTELQAIQNVLNNNKSQHEQLENLYREIVQAGCEKLLNSSGEIDDEFIKAMNLSIKPDDSKAITKIINSYFERVLHHLREKVADADNYHIDSALNKHINTLYLPTTMPEVINKTVDRVKTNSPKSTTSSTSSNSPRSLAPDESNLSESKEEKTSHNSTTMIVDQLQSQKSRDECIVYTWDEFFEDGLSDTDDVEKENTKISASIDQADQTLEHVMSKISTVFKI